MKYTHSGGSGELWCPSGSSRLIEQDNRISSYLDDRYKVRYSLSVLFHLNSISIYYLKLEEGFPKTLLLTNGFV